MSETRMKWTVDVAKGRFAIQGMVTNGGELAPLVEKAAPRAAITMDLGGLRAFTSSGVQGWLRFLDALREKGCVVVFERCSPAVVKQTMAISDFLAGGQVGALLAPYVCPKCEGEAEEEVLVGAKEGALAASRRCKCGAEMEFDDLKQPYVELLREAAARAAG
jgi:hypothetical protein